MEQDKKNYPILNPCKPVTSFVSKTDAARIVVEVPQTKESRKFMITTEV